MKYQKLFVLAFFAMIALACLQASVLGQSASEAKLANVSGGGSSVKLDILVSNSGSTLVISAPDGRTFRRDFKTGTVPEFSLVDKAGERLPDGVYTYELRLNSAAMERQRATRSRDDESESERTSRKRMIVPNSVQSGSFTIMNGSVIVAGTIEDSRRIAANKEQRHELIVANTLARLRNHRVPTRVLPDDVIPDDLIVQGSACVGLDCVNGEVFGFDTIRLKENNDRIQFDDTSTSAGFPTNNWQIRANSSASGGASFLGFVDQGATGNSETGTIVFEVDAGAPANSLKVASTGKVGLRTATPVLDFHITTSDTPAHRLEQTNQGGFTAQTWDIAGNEANFFVRDVTGGSRLPFRIRPGAPTSSIDISANGDVGIGTASPLAKLHVFSTATADAFGGFGPDPSAGPALNYGYAGASIGRGAGFFNVRPDASAVAPNPSLRFLTVNVERMIITNAGNIGIGTSAPTDTLSVNGTASKPGGGSWAVFSDERLKNIKGNYTTGLNALMKLQPLRYQYKPDNALGLKFDRENIGFGAEALKKVIPEAVTTSENGYLMVNNDPIIWTMLNAIKEQQKQIEELKSEVQQLRALANKPQN